VRGENLLDEAYQEVFGFDAPSRQLYLGVALGFGG
jgi:outer membrane cobalamin receptor